MFQKLYSLFMSPFRRHVYDFDNVELKDKQHPKGEETALLYFVVHCKYCHKELSVDRLTYLGLKANLYKAGLFCIRDPMVFEKWQESRVERREYLSGSPLSESDQESVDLGVKH